MSESGRLLRARDVAQILACTARHVYALIAAGDLPGVKIGDKAVRVRAEDLEAWIESRSTKASA